MTEPIRAAEVLAEAGYCWRDRPISQRVDDPLTMTEAQVDALLALFPEGDVVIRRDEHRTVAGLEVAPGLCWGCNGSKYERLLGEDNAEVVIACSVCNGAGLLYRLVPLSREAE